MPSKVVEQPLSLTAFGLSLLTDLDPPGSWEPRRPGQRPIRVRAATRESIAGLWSGRESSGWEGTVDGGVFIAERGVAGDYRFLHGPEHRQADPTDRGAESSAAGEEDDELFARARAAHYLSADGGMLSCAPSDPTDPAWWRIVLDSVLFSVALLAGYEALHAGAVATSSGAVAIAAGTGGGKSTLVGELLVRGLTLMADDVLVLEPAPAGGAPLAHPAPPLMTVPSARMASLRRIPEKRRPRTVAMVEDEHWTAVPVCSQPLPLRSLVILSRQEGAPTELQRVKRPLGVLLESLLRFPRTRERERSRFELAAAIAVHVPIWELRADPAVTPGRLAELVLAGPASGAKALAHVSDMPVRC